MKSKKLSIGILTFLVLLFAMHGVLFLVYFFFPDSAFSRLVCTTINQDFVRNHSIALGIMPFLIIALLVALLRKSEKTRVWHDNFFSVYESVFLNLSTGLIITDSDRRILYLNPAARDLVRQTSDKKLVGLLYTQIVDPLLVPVVERLSSAFDTGENFTREFRVYLPDGIRCIKCDFYSMPESGLGKIYVISLEDKTDEDNIRQKLSAQLEETHRYAHAKDNFFANMSHEIRTPINAILGMTYFVKTVSTEKKTLDYIRKIESASEMLLGVVNDILDFSKMQENKFTLKPENFNLADIRKILQDLFALKAEQKGLDLVIEFDCPDAFFVYGDQFRMTQIFMNLVSNAIKFTERGIVSVSLNHEIIGNDIILRCTVRDTGCGLSEDDISRLFTEFEQFGKVLVKNHEGTGLGLAISKRLVELMHGVIWVDSMLNKGSSFHFVVVLKKPVPALATDAAPSLPRIVRSTGRVLVVEDNEINSEIAQSLLAELGLSVDHADDGIEAIEICRARDRDYYDLILMDIHMPRMNGYDTARVLKTELALTCPILAVTATSENSETLEANRDVISGAILKPYSPGVFKALFGVPFGET
jgi:signal transduction histidine kinase